MYVCVYINTHKDVVCVRVYACVHGAPITIFDDDLLKMSVFLSLSLSLKLVFISDTSALLWVVTLRISPHPTDIFYIEDSKNKRLSKTTIIAKYLLIYCQKMYCTLPLSQSGSFVA